MLSSKDRAAMSLNFVISRVTFVKCTSSKVEGEPVVCVIWGDQGRQKP